MESAFPDDVDELFSRLESVVSLSGDIMTKTKTLLFTGLAAAAMLAGQAYAGPINEPPPPGWILSLSGLPLPHSAYTQYTVDFTATQAMTNISFALRDDPAFISLDNIIVANTLSPSTNLILNGGFEDGVATSGGNADAPVDWSYLNTFGAAFGGVVRCDGGGQGGSSCEWYDGAVQAYDGITQGIATTIGDTYSISFWAVENNSDPNWSELSTNGDVTGTGGNGINITVYAGAIPHRAVPEPAELGMFGLGALLIGMFMGLRRRFP